MVSLTPLSEASPAPLGLFLPFGPIIIQIFDTSNSSIHLSYVLVSVVVVRPCLYPYK